MSRDKDGIDKKKAAEMVGKVVLVGVTYRNAKGEISETREYFGVVDRINADEGLVIIRGDTEEEMSLPPMLEHYQKAKPGTYNLKSCDYAVEDPDYLATWVVNLSPHSEKRPSR